MSIPVGFNHLWGRAESCCRRVAPAIVLLVVCLANRSVVSYGATNLPTVTSIYVFLPDRSEVEYSDPGHGVYETYEVRGQFQLIARPDYGDAWFDKVDGTLIEENGSVHDDDLDDIFDLFYLDGVVINNSLVEFTGPNWDGGEIFVSATFTGDLVYLEGETIPPDPDDDDYPYYELDAVAVRKYGGGTGVAANPYLLYTPKHLNSISDYPEDWDKQFKLTANIDLADYKGTDFHLLGYCNESGSKPFSGVFNGNGFAISHFTYAAAGADGIGLFAYVAGDNAQIKNLGMVDPNVDGGDGSCIGALVGRLGGGLVTDCYVRDGRVAGGEIIGGLVGQNGLCPSMTCGEDKPCQAGTLKGCSSTANVTGITAIGGLVGSNDGDVVDSNSTAIVAGDYAVGGLAGLNGGTVATSHAAGAVSGIKWIGGLVGDNQGGICGSDSAGTVSGLEDAGGLVGENNGGSITICHSTSTVDGSSNVGGLAGLNAGNINRSSSAGAVAGDLYVGGLTGENALRISGCYSAATVSAQIGLAGGLAGANDSSGNVTDSYASGGVTGGVYAGGLLGSNDGIVMRCYAAGAVAGLSDVGGLIGYSTDQACALFSYWDTTTSGKATSAGGVGKTTPDMKKAGTFIGWGTCSDEPMWMVDEGKDYPRLSWEERPGVAIEAVQLADLLTGGGKEDDPFLVHTADQLNAIGLFPCEWDKHFKLTADVDLSAYAGTKSNIIGVYRIPFTGVFDGDAHVISNFTCDSTAVAYVGLFGCINSLNSQVVNLGLVHPSVSAEATNCVGALAGYLKDGGIVGCYADNADISGLGSVGGLVGRAERGMIENCHSTGSIEADTDVGGVLGRNEDGTITNCYSAVTIEADTNVGGLLGLNEQGTVSDCYSSGTVEANANVGGLLGSNQQGSVADCHATDTVIGVWIVGGLVGDNNGTITGGYSTGSVAASDLVGGLVGSNSGDVENAYSSGQITGNGKVGGLAGSNQGKLANCHATGNINGDKSVGGLAGFNSNGQVTSCYATGNVYGRLSAGGLIGNNLSNTAVTSCYATGVISGYEWIGGLVGRNEGAVAKSYAAGSVSGTMEIGGLVGLNFGQSAIASCYASGPVSGNEWVGGLVGTNNGSISKCYSYGNVTGMPGTVGGLVGFSYGTITGSFWDTQTSGQPTGSLGTGKTTAQMKTKTTFTSAGWDFVAETANGTEDIWRIVEAQDYPRLSWQ